jgi:hypothetical protein
MSVRARGAQDVKTHSSVFGSGSHSNERHVHQFQLAALELECTRRNREKQAALRRLAELDARLAEIEDLMLKRREALGLVDGGPPDTERMKVRKGSAETPAEPRRVLRY